MRLTIDDRAAIEELQALSPSAREILDVICLRNEDAFVPGSPSGMTEFRSGFQSCGRMIRELLDRKIDWEKIINTEDKLERQREKQEKYNGCEL